MSSPMLGILSLVMFVAFSVMVAALAVAVNTVGYVLWNIVILTIKNAEQLYLGERLEHICTSNDGNRRGLTQLEDQSTRRPRQIKWANIT